MIHLSAVNVSKCYFLNRKKLAHTVKFILKSIGVRDASLSIVFVTDRQIARLNSLYRRKNRPTDVLSFSMREGKRLKRDSSILGDVIISVDRAKAQAKSFNSSFRREMYLYIIHGILHLMGYDDETKSARKKMSKKENQLLDKLWQKIE